MKNAEEVPSDVTILRGPDILEAMEEALEVAACLFEASERTELTREEVCIVLRALKRELAEGDGGALYQKVAEVLNEVTRAN